VCADETDTEAAGASLAAKLQKGAVVALWGPLGAGKTCFTRGLARAFGVKEPVTSPTYTFLNEYEGENGLRIFHIDAYRLDETNGLENVCGDEVFEDGVCVVEWPQNIAASLPRDAVRVDIDIMPDGKRQIRMRA
jgi:tRNA threonylcarbamoyladenosine biosynthesis protein TsaE